jgi:SAM-dependent MidA family methyltransferase
MNGLAQKIARLIEAAGPISVADYMTLCLFDLQDGYYTTREPFGVEGDFVTAPEISQMFGELVAIWLINAWQANGRPSSVTIAELGPGRGTLMKDMVRTVEKLAPELKAGAAFAMVEASSRLVAIQQAALRDSGASFLWHDSLDPVPAGPLLIVGNELFDALPFRQFVLKDGQWLERAVGLDSSGNLQFVAGTASLDPASLPKEAETKVNGSVVELAPARSALMSAIAERIAAHGGAGLFFDYGHLRSGTGDTFQAVRKHRYEGVFDNPGEADLTSHVDFSALAMAARLKGLDAHLATQGEFLLGMGLLERAGKLGSIGDDAARSKIASEVERLAGADGMGNLFKVLTILPTGMPAPPFRSAS